jgi:glycosyltransferase involved in cell wall biosynthesis
MKRISVVIATKDRATYLARALDSFATQTDAPAFEVVVVDNGSTDATAGVVRDAAARSPFPIHYTFEGEPNRGKARNRGIALAQGQLVLFCDDDVQAPAGWLRAHDEAHRRNAGPHVVNGPIVNVPGYDTGRKPSAVNYSRAFLCTCNVSMRRDDVERVGGFDETFRLYGWEDTELGVRLREAGVAWAFAWDAYIWHIKPPRENTLEVETQKALEKARMAGRFVDKHPTKRARMATGAHGINVIRGKYLLPDSLLAVYAGVATGERVPGWVRALARSQFLDGVYTRELIAVLERRERNGAR